MHAYTTNHNGVKFTFDYLYSLFHQTQLLTLLVMKECFGGYELVRSWF